MHMRAPIDVHIEFGEFVFGIRLRGEFVFGAQFVFGNSSWLFVFGGDSSSGRNSSSGNSSSEFVFVGIRLRKFVLGLRLRIAIQFVLGEFVSGLRVRIPIPLRGIRLRNPPSGGVRLRGTIRLQNSSSGANSSSGSNSSSGNLSSQFVFGICLRLRRKSDTRIAASMYLWMY